MLSAQCVDLWSDFYFPMRGHAADGPVSLVFQLQDNLINPPLQEKAEQTLWHVVSVPFSKVCLWYNINSRIYKTITILIGPPTLFMSSASAEVHIHSISVAGVGARITSCVHIWSHSHYGDTWNLNPSPDSFAINDQVIHSNRNCEKMWALTL